MKKLEESYCHLLTTWKRPNVLQAILWTINGLSGFVFKPWSTQEFVRKCEILVFNESIRDNSIMELLAWIFFSEFGWDKSWKTNGIFYFNQIELGIGISSDTKCRVTFDFEYSNVRAWNSKLLKPSAHCFVFYI